MLLNHSRASDFALFFFASTVAAYVFNSLIGFGYFKEVLGHSPGPCRAINVNGSEDVHVLSSGLALFSSGLRYTVQLTIDPSIKLRKGNLYLLDLNEPNSAPVILTLKNFNRTDFNPHGISIHEDRRTDRITLFVINHKVDAQAVEIFNFDEKQRCLYHRKTVVDERIYSPNDIQAVGHDSFYVTNDHYFHFTRSVLRTLEVALLHLFLRSDVVLYDGLKTRSAASGLFGPNGVALDRSGKFLLVSAGFANAVNVYKRHKDNSLKLIQEIPIGTHADNINLDRDTGSFWIGGVPKGLDFVKYTKDLRHPAPSQVLKLHLGQLRRGHFPGYELREVYLNDGREHRGSTAAAHYRGRLLIGGIFDKLLMCEVRAY